MFVKQNLKLQTLGDRIFQALKGEEGEGEGREEEEEREEEETNEEEK